MRPHEILNMYLTKLIKDEQFIDKYKRDVVMENKKEVITNHPVDVFLNLVIQESLAVETASILLDLEDPPKSTLTDIFSHYVKYDSRFAATRNTIPFCKEMPYY
jgi:hypothetical protein